MVAGHPAALADHCLEPTGSRLDEWWQRLNSTPARAAAWAWGLPLAITLLAAVLRLWNLGQPGTLVFDETYYVKDAWTLLNLGYEGRWPAEANESFNAGLVDGYSTTGSYVVHPPLGKWIIALGLAVFGAETAVGWRVGTAVVGILLVVLVMLLARLLFRSTLATALAGFFFAIDGHAIVMSRTALLDGILAFFVVLGVVFVLLDRRHHQSRIAEWIVRRRDAELATTWGAAFWWRPWLMAAAVAFGAACAVKWNGAYFLAAFAVFSVLSDALERRRAGVTFWMSGTLFTQGPVSFVLVVPLAIVVYLASWTGWLVTDGGYYRHWAASPENALQGAFEWVPLALQSLWHYHESAYNYHVGVTSEHGWRANPLTWLLLVRPTMMYYRGSDLGDDGCLADRCGAVVHDLANPLLWWAAIAALVFLIVRLLMRREWQVGVLVLGVAAGYVPWLLYLDRTVFQFYTIVFWPFLVVGLAYALTLIAGRASDPTSRRSSGLLLVSVFVVLITAVSAFFYPLWTGMTLDVRFVQLHYWLPTWR
ncbi:MAG: phospholipid carrier-dependent glycosyltransferase [Cryobacterium sp.]|nr:phospholipid carrier-dependent glycosyltransferase [Cryobacterium sp.]